MKWIGFLHFLLSHPEKNKRDKDAGNNGANDRVLFLGGTNRKYDSQNHGNHCCDDHEINQIFKQGGICLVGAYGFGLILSHRIDQIARPSRELLISMHPIQLLHQSLRLGVVLLSFGVENEIKSGNQIHDQQRRNEAAEVKVDTSELFHLLDLPGQRDAEFLTDEQTVGIKPWIGLEYLALCYSPL